MKLKNKIFLISIVLLVILFFNTLSVFAATDIVISDTETLTVPDELEAFKYISFLKVSNGTIYVYWSNEPFYISSWNTGYSISTETSIYYTFYSNLTPEGISKAQSTGSTTGGSGGNQTFKLIASNFDMIDSDGDVTFAQNFTTNSSNSNENTNEKNTILNNSIKSEYINGIFSEIILILPVCLVVIIGFIAIRKAFDFLRNFLHKA